MTNGLAAKLSGDFAFEQSGGVTKVGINNVSVSGCKWKCWKS